MGGVRWRRDGSAGENNHLQVLFAWRLPTSNGSLRDGMALLYSLTPHEGVEPTIYVPGITHEFTVYEVDPETPIDFEKSLFEQKEVSPFVPAVAGYQFRAESAIAAVERVQALVSKVVDFQLVPEDCDAWAAFMSDGVDVVTPVLDVDRVIETAKIERSVSSALDSVAQLWAEDVVDRLRSWGSVAWRADGGRYCGRSHRRVS